MSRSCVRVNVRSVKTFFARQLGSPLPEEHSERNIVEDNADVECADDQVNNAGELVEASSVLEYDCVACFLSHWRVVHDGLQGISLQGLEVHLADLDDDLEGHEVNDAVLDCVLVG